MPYPDNFYTIDLSYPLGSVDQGKVMVRAQAQDAGKSGVYTVAVGGSTSDGKPSWEEGRYNFIPWDLPGDTVITLTMPGHSIDMSVKELLLAMNTVKSHPDVDILALYMEYLVRTPAGQEVPSIGDFATAEAMKMGIATAQADSAIMKAQAWITKFEDVSAEQSNKVLPALPAVKVAHTV